MSRLIHIEKQPLIMAIMNVTPDSFSDGNSQRLVSQTIQQVEQLFLEGADIVDVGAESSRPGAHPISYEEEWQRLAEVLPIIVKYGPISVDTRKSLVAQKAIDCGVTMINDISAGCFDQKMLNVVAKGDVSYVAMHMRGEPQTMQNNLKSYQNVVEEVKKFLENRVQLARACGIKQIFVDPGIGFGKSFDDNWQLTHHLSHFQKIADGVVYGCSRKKFLSDVINEKESWQERDIATALVNMVALRQQIQIIRVHSVTLAKMAVKITKKMMI